MVAVKKRYLKKGAFHARRKKDKILGEGDTLNILIREEQVHHAEEYGQVIINYDENNGLVEIEVLNASKFFVGF